MFCPSYPSLVGCLWLEAVGPSHLAIAAAAATAPIDTTRTLPALIQTEGLETAALCTL